MADDSQDQVAPQWSEATKRTVAIGGVLLGIFLLYLSRPVLPFLIVASILAFLLNPIVIFFNSQLRMPHWLAVMLTYLLLVIALLLIPLIATPAIINAIATIDIDLVEWVDGTTNWLEETLEELRFIEIFNFQFDLSRVVDPALTTLSGVVPEALIPSAQQIYNSIPSAVELATGLASTVVATLIWIVLAFVFTLIYSIYLSLDLPKLGNTFWEMVPAPYRGEYVELWHRVRSVWAAYFRGQLILGLAVGGIVAVGAAALGVPGALILGIVAGLLEALPNIGPVLAAIPAVILALFQGSSVLDVSNLVFALIVTGFYILVQQLENNIIVPRLIGQAVDLPAVVVMAGVVVGASVGSVLGAFLAVPVMATGRILAQYAYNKIVGRPPFPPQTHLPVRRKRAGPVLRLPSSWRELVPHKGRPVAEYPAGGDAEEDGEPAPPRPGVESEEEPVRQEEA
jgi:predicted PurR-regulated permease PerM